MRPNGQSQRSKNTLLLPSPWSTVSVPCNYGMNSSPKSNSPSFYCVSLGATQLSWQIKNSMGHLILIKHPLRHLARKHLSSMTQPLVHCGPPTPPMVSTMAQPTTTTGASSSISRPHAVANSWTRGGCIQPTAKSLLSLSTTRHSTRRLTSLNVLVTPSPHPPAPNYDTYVQFAN
jgi:hypothetical protein